MLDKTGRDHFVTSFGKRIDFVEGYRASHVRPWNFVTNHTLRDHLPTGMHAFYGNAFSYGIVTDFLTRCNLWGRRYKRSLDIGGSVGVFSRFLRANGDVQHVTVCDIKDGRNRFSPLRYGLFWLKYKLDTFASKFLPVPRKLSLLRKNKNKYGYGTTMRSNAWNMGLWRLPKLDDYIAGDFMTFEAKEKFDLIVSVNAIEYFNYEELFDRVSDLLEDGGTFCFLVNYWWYPVNSITVYGDFPYLAQRLTKEDVKRYYDENFPDQSNEMLKRYEYFNKGERQPVLNDLIECAHRNGLVLAGTERIMPKPWSRDHRSPFTPEELPVQEVLEDIKKFRPDVTLEDLYTSHIMAAFRKPIRK